MGEPGWYLGVDPGPMVRRLTLRSRPADLRWVTERAFLRLAEEGNGGGA
jgi:hypothetical protein